VEHGPIRHTVDKPSARTAARNARLRVADA
jgi:hypothetical protein